GFLVVGGIWGIFEVVRAGVQGFQGLMKVGGIELGRWALSWGLVGAGRSLAQRKMECRVGGVDRD
ncbi:hypothetical protein C0989_000599, partial [Termitomyces sp. Mn162]